MALTEKIEIDKIEVIDWRIQVRQNTTVERDGQFVSNSFHRWILVPDMDISDQDERVQAVCNAAWTDEVRTAYDAFKAAQAEKTI